MLLRIHFVALVAVLLVGCLAGAEGPSPTAEVPTAEVAEDPTPAEATPAPEVEVVPLRFAWPVGLHAVVESRSQRLRDGNSLLPFEAVVRCETTFEEHEAGFQLREENCRIDGLPDEVVDPRLQLMVLAMKAAADAPSHAIIDADGVFLDIGNLEEVTATMKGLFAPMLDGLNEQPAVRAQVEGMLAQLTAPAALRAQFAESWNTAVSFWVGGDLELGAAYELATVEEVPALGNAQVSMQTEFGIVDRVACRESESEPRCVRIEMHSTPEPEQLQAVIEDWMSRLAEAVAAGQVAPQPVYESLQTTTHVVLVTEPDTLIPHSLETVRDTTVTVVGPNDQRQTVRQSDRRSYSYTYPDR